MKLSDYVFNFLSQLGVGRVFMLPGGGAMHLVDSLGKCEGLEFVSCLHEQACAIAAEAHARVTGKPGAVLVTTGPGGTNAMTGVAGAWLESTPCIFISGQVKRADLKTGLGIRQLGPQELDIVALVSPITKYAVMVMDPKTIRYHLEKAATLAMSGRKGPVWIDIPLDVQGATIDPETLPGLEPAAELPEEGAAGLEGAVEATLGLLETSERPVLLVGNGVRLAGAEAVFLRVVEALGIPVLTTWMGADLLADAHPLCFGKPGTVAPRGANFTIQNADLLISVGARLDAAVTGFDQSRFARGARKVVVDIDPHEIAKLGMVVEVPIVADAREFLERLLARVEVAGVKDRRPWLERCAQWKVRYPMVLPEYYETKGCVNSFVLADVLAEVCSERDLLVPGSSGAAIDTFWLGFRTRQGQRLFSTGGLGAMGFGIPAALGACLGSEGRRTICVDGDGGFQMNIQELATIARLSLPIKFFVINNGGYASIRAMQRNHFQGHLVGCDASSGLGLPDTLAVAAAYGLKTFRIKDQATLRGDVQRVLEHPGPVVCEVMADPDQVISPRVSTVVRPDGGMSSRPLEDLWPFLDREELHSNMMIPLLPD